ncbi:small polypeptide DEVIL 22-like [Silene latifolia]|uniref:small polypeptide DEVIL 22-like n=1 Tax=Silene latifolia TaxID=37657 RepID=UPI003D7757A3
MAQFQQYKTISNTPYKRKENGFTKICASLVKEQRARIYILRRCATMLICGYIQDDE